jgi:DNA-binding IclR family transcriptional regulator
MNEFVDYSARLVDTTAQAVWLVLFREVKPNGLAKVSFGQIAELTGVCRRTAIRAIKHLQEAKLVTIEKRGRLNEGPSTYRVHGTPTGDTQVTSAGDTSVTKLVTNRARSW